MKKRRNKHGWIRIVEAFVAVLIIAGVVLVLLDEGRIKKNDNSEEIYKIEESILSDIQNDNAIRSSVLSLDLTAVSNRVNYLKPSFLDCTTKICSIEETCEFGVVLEENIYSRDVIITTNQTDFSPKKVKIFCYRK